LPVSHPPDSTHAAHQTHATHPTHQTHPPYQTDLAYPTYLTAVAFAVAVAAFAVGVRWGTFAAGGSDSSCYLSEARLLSRGTTHIEQPLIMAAPWPRAAWTFTPAGHLPSPIRNDFIVPICPPGLPLLMAAAQTIHVSPPLVVPLCGALAVWLAFVLGKRLDGPLTGTASAVLLACSPVFLFQVVQPMTDVPAATWWLLVAVLVGGRDEKSRHPFAAGLAASMATLTRPNLLPLAAVVTGYIGFVSAPRRLQATARFVVGLAPGLLLLAALQRATYGSAFASGYGSPADLFHAASVLPNLERYGRWLLETHTPVLALAVVAPFILRRAAAWLCLLLAAGTVVAYLPYQVFDDWWYLRFLLPAIAFLIVLSTTAIVRAADYAIRHYKGHNGHQGKTRWEWTFVSLVSFVVICLGTLWVNTARSRSAFDLQRLERHFIEAGRFVAERLPDRAAILTVRHSGSVYYYAQRPTVSWDTLDSGSLDAALTFLRAQGLIPMLLLDAAEEPEFRARFAAASDAGRLDWPPLARVGRTIRVYDPADRARYLAGATIPTIDWPAPKRF
jgi:hypothetical protein